MMKRLLPLLLCLTVLMGCNAKQAAAPELGAGVTPVKRATLYRYGPDKGQLMVTSNFRNLVTKKTHTQTMFFDYAVTAEGEALKWHMVMPKYIKDGRPHEPHLPLVVVDAICDKTGICSSMDISSPMMRSLPHGEEREKSFLNSLKFSLEDLSSPLPTKPIKTGDPLKVVRVNSMGGINLTQDGLLSLKLEGEMVRNGETYVTGTMDEDQVLTLEGKMVLLKLKGYSIMKKTSMTPTDAAVAATLVDADGEPLLAIQVILKSTEIN